MAEIDTHWREFVHSLEGLSSQMHGPQDLEQVLLGAHTLIHDAVGHAQKNGPRLSAQVRRGHLVPNWEGREALIEKTHIGWLKTHRLGHLVLFKIHPATCVQAEDILAHGRESSIGQIRLNN